MSRDYDEMTRDELEELYHELSGEIECYSADSPTYWELKDELNEIESAMQYASDDEDEELKYEEYDTEDDE